MSRANIIRPIRQALTRPIAGHTRHVFPGLVSTRFQSSANELPDPADEDVRFPRAVQAIYLQPLRREAEFGVPSCDLQLRSFSIPNLEFFCDFALRAAYFLGLPAFGPVPLPRITERWTVPRSPFIHKKSQENFERVTRRRLIQIRDGHPETVQIWLAFLQKHAYFGIGMKANMWEYDSMDVPKEMDGEMESMQKAIDEKMEFLGQKNALGTVDAVKELLAKETFKRRKSSTTTTTTTSSINPDDKDQQQHAVIFSGIQPTGIPHLGNYLGAMRQWKRLQDVAGEDDKLIFSIVDLHAITVPQNAEALRIRRREMLAALLAIGLDPKKSIMFYQSSVKQHAELMWILSCTASMGYLSRMTQYKSKLLATNKAEDLEHAISSRLKLGLFSYPVLQAADILVHRATHVPVGDDQRQHLEFARECVTNFNHTYNEPILVSPETITTVSSRIMDLRKPTSKMSKSSPNERSRILITSPEKEIRQRIAGAVTDSFNGVTYDPVSRPGVANLLEILAQCSRDGGDMSPEETAAALASQGATLGDLKNRAAQAVVDELRGVRERYVALLDRQCGKYIDDIEAEGAEVARGNAEETMRVVRNAVGLGGLR
ncbi:hypothetical protein GGS20DRAFT_579233 [Poronia punctata]|nr:hypothetical protein GGS20DRAFT_579233 [Poronia punctata]